MKLSMSILCTSKSPESSYSSRLMRSSWKRSLYGSLIQLPSSWLYKLETKWVNPCKRTSGRSNYKSKKQYL